MFELDQESPRWITIREGIDPRDYRACKKCGTLHHYIRECPVCELRELVVALHPEYIKEG